MLVYIRDVSLSDLTKNNLMVYESGVATCKSTIGYICKFSCNTSALTSYNKLLRMTKVC